MLASLEEHYGRTPDARVVWNGRDPSHFRRGPKEEFILTAGRLWDEGKNVEALARITADLPWPVYVAGETRGLRLPGCRALGQLAGAELTGWLARAGIYALPARYEPFGLSALEAALSGCALVLGDIASLREVWQDAALYVPPNDSGALRERLHALIANRPLREEMARRSFEHARQFTPERMADEYLMAYHDAAGAWKTLCA
jgi:glycosyltransferase involved in cell wall biosynthesis